MAPPFVARIIDWMQMCTFKCDENCVRSQILGNNETTPRLPDSLLGEVTKASETRAKGN